MDWRRVKARKSAKHGRGHFRGPVMWASSVRLFFGDGSRENLRRPGGGRARALSSDFGSLPVMKTFRRFVRTWRGRKDLSVTWMLASRSVVSAFRLARGWKESTVRALEKPPSRQRVSSWVRAPSGERSEKLQLAKRMSVRRLVSFSMPWSDLSLWLPEMARLCRFFSGLRISRLRLWVTANLQCG